MAPSFRAQRPALVVVDVQNSSFEAEELQQQRPALLAKVNELVAAARRGDRPVIAVRTQHERDRSTWTLNMLEDGEGFAYPGTHQARLVDELDADDCIEVVKTRDSAFHSTNLLELLREHDVDGIVLCGLSTHSRVAQTAIGGFAHDVPCAVAKDALASEDPELSEAMLTFLEQEMRQPLLGEDECVDVLAG